MGIYSKTKSAAATAFAAIAIGAMSLVFNPANGSAQESRRFQQDVEDANFNSASLRSISTVKMFGSASLESGLSIMNQKYEGEASKTIVKSGAEAWYPMISGENAINAAKIGYSVLYNGESGGVLHSIDLGYGLAYVKKNYSFTFGSEVSLKGVHDLNFDNLSLQFISGFAKNYSAGVIASISPKGLDYLTFGFDYSNPKDGFGISANLDKSIRRDGTEDRPNSTVTIGFDKRLSDRKVDAWSIIGSIGVSDNYRYYVSDYRNGEYEPNKQKLVDDKQLIISGDVGVRKKFLHDNGFFSFKLGFGTASRRDALYDAPKKSTVGAKMTVGFKL